MSALIVAFSASIFSKAVMFGSSIVLSLLAALGLGSGGGVGGRVGVGVGDEISGSTGGYVFRPPGSTQNWTTAIPCTFVNIREMYLDHVFEKLLLDRVFRDAVTIFHNVVHVK